MAKPIFGTTIPDAADVPIENGAGQNTVSPLIGDVQAFIDSVCSPTRSVKPSYLANNEIDYVEFFVAAVQTTINRRARVDVVYTGNNPTSEVWKLYDTDGTTILKTVTLTHTWVANDLTSTTRVTV